MGALSEKADDFPCCTPPPAPDYARIAVLQTERAHIGRELVRAGNHSHTTPTPNVDRYYTLDNAIKKELGL